MYRKIAVGCALAAYVGVISTAHAHTWNTNAWPAYQHPRAGSLRVSDSTNAITKILNVLTDSAVYDPEVSFWRSQKTNLQECKDALEIAIIIDSKRWVNVVDYPLGSQALEDAMNTNTSPHRYNITDMLTQCYLPTNYLEYTPWRFISGLGTYTNDISVGHPYGFTNSFTADGGTNFPPGRSAWYTTDYGWDGISNISERLYVIQRYDNNDYPLHKYKRRNTGPTLGGGATIGAAISDAIYRYTLQGTGTVSTFYLYTEIDNQYEPTYYGAYVQDQWAPSISNNFSAGLSGLEYATMAYTNRGYFYFNAGTNTMDAFDSHGYGLSEGWNYIANSTWALAITNSSGTVVSDYGVSFLSEGVGSFNWQESPTTNDTRWRIGFNVAGTRWLIEFDFD